MAYGENKGRFRETRAGRFDPNMGAAEAPVKSTDVEGAGFGTCSVSDGLQNTFLELHSYKGYPRPIHGHGYDLSQGALSKAKGGRKRASSGKRRRTREDEPLGEGGPDEAAAFIAETAADLVRLARSHQLEMLSHLLRMAELEAEEYLLLRGKQKLP